MTNYKILSKAAEQLEIKVNKLESKVEALQEENKNLTLGLAALAEMFRRADYKNESGKEPVKNPLGKIGFDINTDRKSENELRLVITQKDDIYSFRFLSGDAKNSN